MQSEGNPRYLRYHVSAVKGVAFSPKDRYLFASGGNEGKVNLYSCSNSLSHQLVISYQLTNANVSRNINGIRFTSDGRRILCATTSRRLTVLDVERGEQILCYDNCAFNGRDGKVPLAADPCCPHFAVCSCVNGKGLTLFDLRMPLPLDFVFDLHSNVIKDITFLNNSWPFMKTNESSGLVSLSCDGVCKITTLDGRFLHCFEVGHSSNSITTTPEAYTATNSDGPFKSLMMIGGESMTGYTPDVGLKEKHNVCDKSQIYKLKYTSNGSLLYAAFEGGKVKRYRRYPDHHSYIADVLSHKGDVYDLDISPYDEFLVTASKDKTVGVLCLGPPNHGWTGCCQLT